MKLPGFTTVRMMAMFAHLRSSQRKRHGTIFSSVHTKLLYNSAWLSNSIVGGLIFTRQTDIVVCEVGQYYFFFSLLLPDIHISIWRYPLVQRLKSKASFQCVMNQVEAATTCWVDCTWISCAVRGTVYKTSLWCPMTQLLREIARVNQKRMLKLWSRAAFCSCRLWKERISCKTPAGQG